MTWEIEGGDDRQGEEIEIEDKPSKRREITSGIHQQTHSECEDLMFVDECIKCCMFNCICYIRHDDFKLFYHEC